MTITPFKVSDYAEIELGNGLGLEHWGLVGGIFPALEMMEKTGTYCTVRDGEKIVMIGGYFEFLKGVCEVSFYPSAQFLAKPTHGYKMIKRYLAILVPQFRRLQVHCRREDKFVEFAKRLGFKQEGIMEKFSFCGADHVMMAIVRK